MLFLDELPEYTRQVLEVLREPLESGHICISRANAQVDFPAKFQLVAAMNPCPCGYFGDKSDRCRCTPNQIARYKDKISGPLLDRIDMQVQVAKIPISEMQNADSPENSDCVRQRVSKARDSQLARQDCSNAELRAKALKAACNLQKGEQAMLANAIEKLKLSARAYDRILRVARTIADLDGYKDITARHISEALSYRSFDRFYSSN